MNDFWRILYNGVEKSLAAWGISAATLKLVNQASDTLDLTFDGLLFTADVPFAFDQFVTLKRNGVVCFVGRVLTTPVQGTPRRESVSLTVHGPWEELEQTVFQQFWSMSGGDGAAELVSRIILGQHRDGTKMNAADGVQEVMDYATTTCGLNIQLGQNMVTMAINFSELRDQTCAEVLRKYLMWQPSRVSWIDYSTTPPTLNFTDRPEAAAITLAIGNGSPLSAVPNLTPRSDIQIPGVFLKYLVAETINDSRVLNIVKDIYPADASETTRRALIMSFDFDGGSYTSTTVEQKIKVRTLPTNFTDTNGSNDSLWWWSLKQPWLYAMTSVTIKNPEFQYTWDAAGAWESAWKFYLNELVEGTWQDWMETETTPAIHAMAVKVRADCEYTYTDDQDAVITKTCKLSATFTSTNAASGTYKKTTSEIVAGQAPPTGIAEILYNSLAPLQYDGNFTLLEREAGGLGLHPGAVINLTGGRPEWATMRAQIQTVSIDIMDGMTSITVGPAKHLGPDDLVKLLQPTRIQIQPLNDQSRVSGQSKSAGNTVDGAQLAPFEDGSTGGGIYSQQTWQKKDDDVNKQNRKVVIDVANLPSGASDNKEMRIRKVDLCDNTFMYVLATEPQSNSS